MRKIMLLRYRDILILGVCLFFSVQVIACGTLLYPERRGQTKGEIDVSIAVMDGIGLLFFIIPGVIAYAVDFSSGAIYLPADDTNKKKMKRMEKGLFGKIQEDGQWKVITVDPRKLNSATIEAIVKVHTGKTLRLYDDALVIKAKTAVDIQKNLTRLSVQHGIPPILVQGKHLNPSPPSVLGPLAGFKF